MSDLTKFEKRKLEKDLRMSGGYVLNFSNHTFKDFMLETVNVTIYDEKYICETGSKANRLRAFWNIEPNSKVALVLDALLADWEEYAGLNLPPPSDEYLKILHRLKESAPVPELSVIQPNADEKGFDALAKAVRDSIERNEPEAGLDRFHTFLIKYFRNLCQKHGIEILKEKEKPLHSLVGEYVKAIKRKGLIETVITERILKSTISIMEAFNKIRNDHSFAHDNQLLNSHESFLIFGYVTSSIKFIETIEHQKNIEN